MRNKIFSIFLAALLSPAPLLAQSEQVGTVIFIRAKPVKYELQSPDTSQEKCKDRDYCFGMTFKVKFKVMEIVTGKIHERYIFGNVIANDASYFKNKDFYVVLSPSKDGIGYTILNASPETKLFCVGPEAAWLKSDNEMNRQFRYRLHYEGIDGVPGKEQYCFG